MRVSAACCCQRVLRVHRAERGVDPAGGERGVGVRLRPLADGEDVDPSLGELDRGARGRGPGPRRLAPMAALRSHHGGETNSVPRHDDQHDSRSTWRSRTHVRCEAPVGQWLLEPVAAAAEDPARWRGRRAAPTHGLGAGRRRVRPRRDRHRRRSRSARHSRVRAGLVSGTSSSLAARRRALSTPCPLARSDWTAADHVTTSSGESGRIAVGRATADRDTACAISAGSGRRTGASIALWSAVSRAFEGTRCRTPRRSGWRRGPMARVGWSATPEGPVSVPGEQVVRDGGGRAGPEEAVHGLTCHVRLAPLGASGAEDVPARIRGRQAACEYRDGATIGPDRGRSSPLPAVGAGIAGVRGVRCRG